MLAEGDRKRIYEEEKARVEARKDLERKAYEEEKARVAARKELDQEEAKHDAGLSRISLALGVLSIFLSIFTGIPALITGIKALHEKRPGRGMAIAGIVLGALGIVSAILTVYFVFVVGSN